MSIKDCFIARFKRTGRWFRNLSLVNEIVVSIAAIAFLATAVAVPIIATRDTEPGFMHACFVDGHAVYDTPNCETRDLIIWTEVQRPISVEVKTYFSNDLEEQQRAERIVKVAISEFNIQLGKRLFLFNSNTNSSVQVVWNYPVILNKNSRVRDMVEDIHVGGFVNHSKTGNRIFASIKVTQTYNDRIAFITLLHELGHVVNLAHDDHPSSIMFPYLLTENLDINLSSNIRLSDYDRSILRKLYF